MRKMFLHYEKQNAAQSMMRYAGDGNYSITSAHIPQCRMLQIDRKKLGRPHCYRYCTQILKKGA